MTALHPTTQTESLLLEERDAALARAERAERLLGEAMADHARNLLALDASLAAERAAHAAETARADRHERDLTSLAGELGEAARRVGEERRLRESAMELCKNVSDSNAALRRQLSRLEQEVVDTSTVAESIIMAPSPPAKTDERLEVALAEAITIGRRAIQTMPKPGDLQRLRQLGRLVGS